MSLLFLLGILGRCLPSLGLRLLLLRLLIWLSSLFVYELLLFEIAHEVEQRIIQSNWEIEIEQLLDLDFRHFALCILKCLFDWHINLSLLDKWLEEVEVLVEVIALKRNRYFDAIDEAVWLLLRFDFDVLRFNRDYWRKLAAHILVSIFLAAIQAYYGALSDFFDDREIELAQPDKTLLVLDARLIIFDVVRELWLLIQNLLIKFSLSSLILPLDMLQNLFNGLKPILYFLT